MSKCDLRVELNDNQFQFKQGDTITGTVYVSVNKSVKCKDLFAELKWHTHGAGNKSRRTISKISLFSGTLEPGDYHYDFSLEIEEESPATYHGHYINIDWMVQAQIDIPWAIDPKAHCDIIVDRTEKSSPLSQNNKINIENKLQSKLWMIFAIIFGSPFFLAGLYSVIMQQYVGLIFLIVGGALIGGGIFIGIRNNLASIKLGKLEAYINKDTFAPDEAIIVELRCCPKQSIPLNAINVILEGTEVATSGHGSNSTTYRHEFCKETCILESSRILKPYIPFSHKTDISIPFDAPSSFMTSDNSILWYVSLEIDIENWPDWVARKAIQVI